MEQSDKICSLELSIDLQEDLRALNHPDLLMAPESFDFLLQTVCEDLTKIPITRSNNDVFKDIQDHKGLLVKFKAPLINQWCRSLMTFLVKAVAEKASVDDVTLCLTDLGWTPQYVAKFLKLYELNQLKIRTILKLFQSSPPRLIDLRWRMDLRLESSMNSQVSKLWYIIDIILEENGVQQTFTFDVNHSQLEDLVATLKDAYNSTKRVSSI